MSTCKKIALNIPAAQVNNVTIMNKQQNKESYKQLIYIYISHVNVTQTVPYISPLMPMHQDPLLASTHIRTEGLYVKTTIIYQLKRLCVPDCAYTKNIFINSIHVSLYDISPTQNILYQIKRDMAVWKRLGCPQRNQRTWWQTVATPYTGLA